MSQTVSEITTPKKEQKNGAWKTKKQVKTVLSIRNGEKGRDVPAPTATHPALTGERWEWGRVRINRDTHHGRGTTYATATENIFCALRDTYRLAVSPQAPSGVDTHNGVCEFTINKENKKENRQPTFRFLPPI